MIKIINERLCFKFLERIISKNKLSKFNTDKLFKVYIEKKIR